MSAGQPTAPPASVGQTVIPYETFQAAYQKDPGQMHDAIEAATASASGGDPAVQQQMLADWHNAIAQLAQDAPSSAKTGGTPILHTPQNDLASRLQTALVK